MATPAWIEGAGLVTGSRGEDFLEKAKEMLKGTPWERDAQSVAPSGAPRAGASSEDERSQLLLRTSEVLNSILSLEEVVQRTMDLAIRYLNAERGIIFLLDERGEFKPIAQSNVESQLLADAMEYSESVLRRAAEDHVLWSGNAVTDLLRSLS